MSVDRHAVLKTWIAAVLWLIVIAIESSSIGASTNTSRILYPLLHWLFKLDPSHFETWHFFIRKGGHCFGYGLLSILLYRAWHATLPGNVISRWSVRWAGLALLGTAIVASLDEWNQSFDPLRTGTVHDVILDTCAGIVAQFLVFSWIKLFSKSSSTQDISNIS